MRFAHHNDELALPAFISSLRRSQINDVGYT